MALPPSDVAAIRGAENALVDAFESTDRTAWVDFYTDDAIFVGPGMAAIEGRDALLGAAEVVSISSMEIVTESTLGAGDFAATYGRGSWARRARTPHGFGDASSWSGVESPITAGASRASC